MHTGRKRVCYALSIIGNNGHIAFNFRWLLLDVKVNGVEVFLKEKLGQIKFITPYRLTRASTSIISHMLSGMEGVRFCLVMGSFFFPLHEPVGFFLLSLSISPSGAAGV